MSRYSERHDALPSSRRQPALPRRLDDDGVARNLANALNERVKVICSLTHDGITWGKYRKYDAGVMHLVFRAMEPPPFKLKFFKLDLKLASLHDQAVVCLLQEDQPVQFTGVAPAYVEGRPWTESQSSASSLDPELQIGGGGGRLGSFARTKEKSVLFRWIFRSHALPDRESNMMTNAGWIWESNPIDPQIEDRGYLFGGMAFRHCSQPFTLTCEVEGTLCQGPIWLRFRTLKAKPSTWQKTPPASAVDIEHLVRELEPNMLARNQVAVARADSPAQAANTGGQFAGTAT